MDRLDVNRLAFVLERGIPTTRTGGEDGLKGELEK